MANLALTYRNQGRWKEAEALEVQVMETRKRVLGQEHPDTLTSMANLASTYRNQGRWKETEELPCRLLPSFSLSATVPCFLFRQVRTPTTLADARPKPGSRAVKLVWLPPSQAKTKIQPIDLWGSIDPANAESQ
jgi:hypothetical protein